MRDIVINRTTNSAVRGRGPANPMKIRVEKKAVAVATKTGELTKYSTWGGTAPQRLHLELEKESMTKLLKSSMK